MTGLVIQFDTRGAEGTAHVRTTVSGQVVQLDESLAALGIPDAYSFTGDVHYTCDSGTLTLILPRVTFVLGRD